MPTVFSRIISGELPGTFVWRDELCVAFLSINPLARGHVLVVPRLEVDQWTDLDANHWRHLTAVAHVIGRAQKAVLACERVGVIVAGYEVPHVHIHVVPTRSMSELDFAHAARSVDRDDMAAVADQLRAALTAEGHAEASV